MATTVNSGHAEVKFVENAKANPMSKIGDPYSYGRLKKQECIEPGQVAEFR
jgi:hypothetical protein